MKKWLKIIGVLAGIGIVAAVLFFVFVINKSHPDYEKEDAAYILEAKVLFDQYRSGFEATNEKYLGKVIQITGNLNKVELADSATIAIFVFEEGMFGDEGIRCTMMSKFNDQCKLHPINTEITIKGYCTGYNETDVVLSHGSIVGSKE